VKPAFTIDSVILNPPQVSQATLAADPRRGQGRIVCTVEARSGAEPSHLLVLQPRRYHPKNCSIPAGKDLLAGDGTRTLYAGAQRALVPEGLMLATDIIQDSASRLFPMDCAHL
jgi:hypothetical protein